MCELLGGGSSCGMISFISSHFPNLFRQEQVLFLVHILQSLLYPYSRVLVAFFPLSSPPLGHSTQGKWFLVLKTEEQKTIE